MTFKTKKRFIAGAACPLFTINPLWAVIHVLLITTFYIPYMLTLRSYQLFVNDVGVWVFKGIFPWNKGLIGIRWEDIDSAFFTQGFINWVFKSYPVTVSHKYTKASEIHLSHIRNGQVASEKINQLLVDRLSSST